MGHELPSAQCAVAWMGGNGEHLRSNSDLHAANAASVRTHFQLCFLLVIHLCVSSRPRDWTAIKLRLQVEPVKRTILKPEHTIVATWADGYCCHRCTVRGRWRRHRPGGQCLMQSTPDHRCISLLMGSDNGWPVVVSHLTYCQVDHRWQACSVSKARALLQRGLRVLSVLLILNERYLGNKAIAVTTASCNDQLPVIVTAVEAHPLCGARAASAHPEQSRPPVCSVEDPHPDGVVSSTSDKQWLAG
mmetsp:Transcript_85738/g.148497  ORF Transcript_85738/g.148497 Transcript_85738/m.148497 type:complete len:246 (+) Transcript_85738:59-796(+)